MNCRKFKFFHNLNKMSTRNSDKKFLLACIDPFSPKSKGVSLPSGSATASYKSCAVIRTDGQLDTAGNGVIMFNPSIARDACCLWYQGIGTTGLNSTVFPFNTNIVPQTTFAPSAGYYLQNTVLSAASAASLPFTIADAIGSTEQSPSDLDTGNPPTRPPNIRGRVVSVGMKITFSGTTLNDGGVCYALVEPTHDSFQFNNLGESLQQYTSTKVQRMALRNTIELVAFPATRAQQEFSNAYDDLVVNLSAGVTGILPVQGSGNVGFHVARYQVCRNGVSGLNQTPGTGGTTSATFASCAAWECPNVEKALISTLYPLSRRNAQKFSKAYPLGNITATGSVITWASGAPPLSFVGAPITIAAVGNFILGYDGATWLIVDPVLGIPTYAQTVAAGSAVTGFLEVVTPPPIGCVFIQGGTAMAGQTYHIEYIVHVEYSGISVQGRTSANVPNEHVMDLTLSAIDHARETSGQHEAASLKHVALAAVEHVAAQHAPELVRAAADVVGGVLGGPAGAVFGDIAGGLVGQAMKRMRH